MARKRANGNALVPSGKRDAKVNPSASSGKSRELARNGVATGAEFSDLMSALMSDLLQEKVTPGVANAVCNAGGKMLRLVELRYKYGRPSQRTQGELLLTR